MGPSENLERLTVAAACNSSCKQREVLNETINSPVKSVAGQPTSPLWSLGPPRSSRGARFTGEPKKGDGGKPTAILALRESETDKCRRFIQGDTLKDSRKWTLCFTLAPCARRGD